jgi:2-polyprenyl-3-methyl-5-hydroxy-6-metoxy-1,4-benzoquinol methylase
MQASSNVLNGASAAGGAYVPAIKDRWSDDYFDDRTSNNPLRLRQFKLDAELVGRYVTQGNLCDVGCSTGEFLKHLNFQGRFYGIEINDKARQIASEFVSFDKDIFTEKDYFDAVIFRGTIQHVDVPFQMIKLAFQALKPGGCIIFLATPNANSILYKVKHDLPFLDWSLNFYIPGRKELTNALQNFGFQVAEVQLPYWHTPYRRFFRDHALFLLNLCTRKFHKHPFWGSSMNVVAIKPKA